MRSWGQSCWLPTIQAEIELSRGNAAKAIELLQATSSYEMAGELSPAYVRGLGYLGIGQGGAAAGEFQKILSLPGFMGSSHLVPLAHLGVARAHAISGDTAGARTAYQDFFALWKDADPDIPILKEAKAEYTKLKWPEKSFPPKSMCGVGWEARPQGVAEFFPKGNTPDGSLTRFSNRL